MLKIIEELDYKIDKRKNKDNPTFTTLELELDFVRLLSGVYNMEFVDKLDRSRLLDILSLCIHNLNNTIVLSGYIKSIKYLLSLELDNNDTKKWLNE